MTTRTTQELNDVDGAHPTHRPEPSPAAPATFAPTAATARSAIRPHTTPQSCACCQARRPSCASADIDPNGDHGRRLRYIIAVWFSVCLFALLLLWQAVEAEAQRSESPFRSDHDRGAQVALLGNETG